jgi:hypothetical protein
MPREASCTEALLTTVVLLAAALCWLSALYDQGLPGFVGFWIVAGLLAWVWFKRTGDLEASDRPFLIGGLIALALGIAFQFATA